MDRGKLVLLDGPSYRTQHLDLDVDSAELVHDDPARISGIHMPQRQHQMSMPGEYFPEVPKR